MLKKFLFVATPLVGFGWYYVYKNTPQGIFPQSELYKEGEKLFQEAKFQDSLAKFRTYEEELLKKDDRILEPPALAWIKIAEVLCEIGDYT